MAEPGSWEELVARQILMENSLVQILQVPPKYQSRHSFVSKSSSYSSLLLDTCSNRRILPPLSKLKRHQTSHYMNHSRFRYFERSYVFHSVRLKEAIVGSSVAFPGCILRLQGFKTTMTFRSNHSGAPAILCF